MLTAKKALAAARVYTQETAQEMGALKGAPCTIKSIVKSGNLNTVTFEWTDRSEVTHESTMLVLDGADGTDGTDGADGFSPTIVVKTSTDTTYILTITDKNGSYDTPNLKGSGGSGGASAMSDLTDVDLTALANGCALIYDSTAEKWEAVELSLANLSDVDLTGITDGQILAWDDANSKFVPADNTGEEYTAGEGIEISQDNEISSKIVMYTGTKAAWDALPLADKKKYTHASFTGDSESGVVDSTPTEDSVNLVTSGGVFAALEEKADKTDLDAKADIATTPAGYGITDAYTKTETGNAITAEIEKLDVSDAAVAGSYVTEVSEADGKISVVREAADVTPTSASTKMLTSGGAYTALGDKADKVTSATNGDFAGLDASGNLTDSGKKASDFATAQGLADEAKTRGAMGAKNLIPMDQVKDSTVNSHGTWSGNVYTDNGVEFTFNPENGTVVANGTSNGGEGTHATFYYAVRSNDSRLNMPANTYKLTGCPAGGSSSTYFLYLNTKYQSDNTNNGGMTDAGEGVTATYANDMWAGVYVDIANGTTVTNLEFKPMLRLASDIDDTYQPYAKTNLELTADTTGLLDNSEVNGAVNMLPNTATTQAINGVTFTVNSDGSVTVNGTASSTTELPLYTNSDGSPELVGKTVKMSGCPSGGDSSTTYSIQAYRVGTTDGSSGTSTDSGEGATFTWLNNGTGTKAVIKIVIRSGYTASNLTFKPMITVSSYNGEYVPYAKSNRGLTESLKSAYVIMSTSGPVKVVADGVKTYRELLNDLFPAIKTKVGTYASNAIARPTSIRLYIPVTAANATIPQADAFAVNSISSSSTTMDNTFKGTTFKTGTSMVRLLYVRLSSSEGNCRFITADTTTGVITDHSLEVPTSGEEITVYLFAYKPV